VIKLKSKKSWKATPYSWTSKVSDKTKVKKS